MSTTRERFDVLKAVDAALSPGIRTPTKADKYEAYRELLNRTVDTPRGGIVNRPEGIKALAAFIDQQRGTPPFGGISSVEWVECVLSGDEGSRQFFLDHVDESFLDRAIVQLSCPHEDDRSIGIIPPPAAAPPRRQGILQDLQAAADRLHARGDLTVEDKQLFESRLRDTAPETTPLREPTIDVRWDRSEPGAWRVPYGHPSEALESLLETHRRCAAADADTGYWANLRDTHPDPAARAALKNTRSWAHLAARMLPRADVFWWTPQTTQAVQTASESFPLEHTVLRDDMLFSRFGWSVFQKPVMSLALPDEHDRAKWWHAPIVALLWAVVTYPDRGGEWFCLVGFTPTLSRQVSTDPYCLIPAIGCETAMHQRVILEPDASVDLWGDTECGREVNRLMRFVLTAQAFVGQRILTRTGQMAERHTRKRALRAGVPRERVESPIQVVALRRREVEPKVAGGIGPPVEWSCRWIVTGHWRQQPYKEGTRPKFIESYVKGPEDRPLKAPKPTVYAVAR